MPTNIIELDSSQLTRVVGQGEDYAADVVPQLGKNALIVNQMLIDDSIINGAISVTTVATALKVGASRLTNRKTLLIQPTNGNIYIGASGVTTSNGVMVMKNQIVTIAINIELYAIAASSINVRIIEGK